MVLARIGLGVVMLLACSSASFAQAGRPARGESDRTWEVMPYVGLARHSPVGTHLGVTPGRNHLFLGVHVTGAVLRWRGFTLAYAPEVVPLLLLSGNPTYHTVTTTGPPSPLSGVVHVVDGVRPVAGFGVSPVGFEGRVRFGSRVRVYTATAAGFVVFTRSAPDPDARAFNYTFEVGGGVEYRLTPMWRLRLGYKFHHFSNADSAPSNPGVDGKVVLVGLSRAFGKK